MKKTTYELHPKLCLFLNRLLAIAPENAGATSVMIGFEHPPSKEEWSTVSAISVSANRLTEDSTFATARVLPSRLRELADQPCIRRLEGKIGHYLHGV